MGFGEEIYLLKCFFVFFGCFFLCVCLFSQKKGNLVVGSVRVAAGRNRNSIFVFSGAQSLPKR